jgi:hypothetical protein
MASVHLLSAAPADSPDPKAQLDLEQMRDSAAADRFGVHSLVADPDDAELILFVETSSAAGSYFARVRRHPVYRAHRDRAYLFSSTDRPLALVPGIYASIERRWARAAWTRSSGYLGVKEIAPLTYDPHATSSLLYSFAGSGSAHPVREQVLSLRHPESLLVDSDVEPLTPQRYARSIADSSFVLCPRGGGTATFRLFESLMLGRPPVIVSDAWVPPDGPDWDACSIRVFEREVGSIPQLLERRAPDAEAIGAAARAVWLDWFAPEAAFHRCIDWCLELGRLQSQRRGVRRFEPFLQFLRPFHGARAIARR